MKFCKDCKHFKKEYLRDRCTRTQNEHMHIDIVTGKAYQLAEDKHCWIERSDYLGKCGKEAIYFEGKLIYKLKEKIKSLFKKAVNK